MRAIGNDVVDLGDPEAAAGACHARFEKRVFAPEEVALLDASAGSRRLRLRWTLWAAKEAAYKVARKRDATIVFSPRRFMVRLHDDTRATVEHQVEHQQHRFTVALDLGARHVHAIARDGRATCTDGSDGHAAPIPAPAPAAAARIIARVATLEPGNRACPGDLVRALAITTLAPLLAPAPAILSIVRDGRIPRLYDAHGPLDADLSLSHHGRFVAFACVLPVHVVPSAEVPS
jgi:phosphopantetheinyl transferase (holo-ACP synthase)